MIKTAISGADDPAAGELIRILVNHPDVEIVSLIAPRHEGKQVQSVHHGLVGEEPLYFTSSFKPAEADVLFVAAGSVNKEDLTRLHAAYPEIKVIVLTSMKEDEDVVFALPEINRKALVRGAKIASIPTPISSLALVPLYPLALHMLLSGDIRFDISAPEDIVGDDALERSSAEITSALKEAQKSYDGKISFTLLPATSKRGVELKATIPMPVNIEHVLNTYDIYDDHNFSFVTTSPVKLDDVKGTEKIIVSLTPSKEGTLDIHAVADGRLRGSAGEAVHVMNLMFGLHEKTGLYLKPYAY